jgi:hypothetical protein
LSQARGCKQAFGTVKSQASKALTRLKALDVLKVFQPDQLGRVHSEGEPL